MKRKPGGATGIIHQNKTTSWVRGKGEQGEGGGGVDPSGPTNTTFKRHTSYKCPVGCWLDI